MSTKNLTFLFFFIFTRLLFADEIDTQYWQYFKYKTWEKGACSLYTSGEIRVWKDISEPYYYRITENFAYKYLSKEDRKKIGCSLAGLNLEAHYSFYASRDDQHFNYNHRIELEGNPSFFFESGSVIRIRNRLEIQKKEHIKNLEFTLRHRFLTEFPIAGFKYLKAVNFSDEIFYDFDRRKISENRCVPIRLTFLLNSTQLHLYFMIRNLFNSNPRARSWVLGMELDL